MEYEKLLTLIRPASTEIAQQTAKILLNSCYDKIATNSDFRIYDVYEDGDSAPSTQYHV